MILKTKILETILGEIVGALKNVKLPKSQHKNKMTQKAMGDFLASLPFGNSTYWKVTISTSVAIFCTRLCPLLIIHPIIAELRTTAKK
jgi:hypothetical protein